MEAGYTEKEVRLGREAILVLVQEFELHGKSFSCYVQGLPHTSNLHSKYNEVGFLLIGEDNCKQKPFSQEPTYSSFRHLHPRPKGTALDSADLPDMPAQPAVPQ